jgi:hypothetical protein
MWALSFFLFPAVSLFFRFNLSSILCVRVFIPFFQRLRPHGLVDLPESLPFYFYDRG